MICRHNNILILIAVILFNGCGIYSFKGSLPPNIKTIYISPVINSSSEYALSNMLNEQINEQLVKKNILKIEEFYNSDSKLDISIQLVEDIPNEIIPLSTIKTFLIFSTDLRIFFLSKGLRTLKSKTFEVILKCLFI